MTEKRAHRRTGRPRGKRPGSETGAALQALFQAGGSENINTALDLMYPRMLYGGGNVSYSARAIGVTRRTLQRWARRFVAVARALQCAREGREAPYYQV